MAFYELAANDATEEAAETFDKGRPALLSVSRGGTGNVEKNDFGSNGEVDRSSASWFFQEQRCSYLARRQVCNLRATSQPPGKEYNVS